MTAIARLEVIPIHDESLSEDIASAIDALDAFDVSYETTATDTVIEADAAAEVFAAAQAAHDAVDGDRVITAVEIDEQRNRDQHIGDRIASVEAALGRPPRRERPPEGQQPPT